MVRIENVTALVGVSDRGAAIFVRVGIEQRYGQVLLLGRHLDNLCRESFVCQSRHGVSLLER